MPSCDGVHERAGAGRKRVNEPVWSGKERRRAERKAVEYRVRFGSGEGVITNISASGLYLVTDSLSPVGTLLRLNIDFPGLQCGDLLVRARVRRVDHMEGVFGIAMTIEGFAFATLSPPVVDRSHLVEQQRALRLQRRKQ